MVEAKILFVLCFTFHYRSEHERHCPECSFVRGDHTKNVPMSGKQTYLVMDHAFKNVRVERTYNLGQNSLGKCDALICLCDKK